MRLCLLGPPGSGKGTMADRLIRDYKFLYVYPGGMLREEIGKHTRLGKEINSYLSKGKLVPTNIVVHLVRRKILGKKHYLLDGFPRSLDQIEALRDIKQVDNKLVDKVMYLDVPEKEVIKRFAGRRVCQKGLHTYHLEVVPPRKKGICDHDGTKLIKRSDDRPAVIRKRFRVYHEETAEVIQHYRRKGILIRVDGRGTPDIVYGRVRKVL